MNPPPATIHRPRKLSGPGRVEKASQKASAKGKSPSEPSTVSPSERLKEFPNSGLVVSGIHLYCQYCAKIISLKKDTINDHLKSKTHEEKHQAFIKEKENSAVGNWRNQQTPPRLLLK